MSNSWIEQYNSLLAFISDNPEIQIHDCSTIIPAAQRQMFYQLFDTARVSLAYEIDSQLVKEAILCSRSCDKIMQKVKSKIKLDKGECNFFIFALILR